MSFQNLFTIDYTNSLNTENTNNNHQINSNFLPNSNFPTENADNINAESIL